MTLRARRVCFLLMSRAAALALPTRGARAAPARRGVAMSIDRAAGYSLAPDAATGVGGWLAHRASASAGPASGPGDDWVARVAPALAGAAGFAPHAGDRGASK